MIVAPHPDDEIIGAAALIGMLRRHGVRVTVIVVSDGAASHPGSIRWPRERLVRGRRRESLLALRRLGVGAADVRFLNLPDSRLPDHIAACRRALRRVAGSRGVDLIVGPAATDDHPDHRAVAAALTGMPGRARQLRYRVWPASTAATAGTRMVAMSGGHAAKRSLIRLHRTQTGIIDDDPAGFAIAAHELAAFADPRERFVEIRR